MCTLGSFFPFRQNSIGLLPRLDSCHNIKHIYDMMLITSKKVFLGNTLFIDIDAMACPVEELHIISRPLDQVHPQVVPLPLPHDTDSKFQKFLTSLQNHRNHHHCHQEMRVLHDEKSRSVTATSLPI